MLQQTFTISNILESQNSSGNTYVSSATWILSYSDGLSFLKDYSDTIIFNENNCPVSNSNQDVSIFISEYLNFNSYFNNAKSLYMDQYYQTSFTWFIYELLTIPNFEGVENFVTRITWRLHAENNVGNYCDFQSQTFFNKVSDLPYINYNDLKEEDVISWLEATENYEALKEKLNVCLYEKINPIVVSLPLPW